MIELLFLIPSLQHDLGFDLLYLLCDPWSFSLGENVGSFCGGVILLEGADLILFFQL